MRTISFRNDNPTWIYKMSKRGYPTPTRGPLRHCSAAKGHFGAIGYITSQSQAWRTQWSKGLPDDVYTMSRTSPPQLCACISMLDRVTSAYTKACQVIIKMNKLCFVFSVSFRPNDEIVFPAPYVADSDLASPLMPALLIRKYETFGAYVRMPMLASHACTNPILQISFYVSRVTSIFAVKHG